MHTDSSTSPMKYFFRLLLTLVVLPLLLSLLVRSSVALNDKIKHFLIK